MDQKTEDGKVQADANETDDDAQSDIMWDANAAHFDVQKFFELLTQDQETKRRDKMLKRMVQLARCNTGRVFQVMPDFNKSIGDFTDEGGWNWLPKNGWTIWCLCKSYTVGQTRLHYKLPSNI